MIKYEVVEEHLNTLESGSYTAYGICAIDSETDEIAEKVSDVFLSYENAIHFANAINEAQLELAHLYNVIENVLIDGENFEF